MLELMSDPLQVIFTSEKHFSFTNWIADDIWVRDPHKRYLGPKRYEHLIESLGEVAQFVVCTRSGQLRKSAISRVPSELRKFRQRHAHFAGKNECQEKYRKRCD